MTCARMPTPSATRLALAFLVKAGEGKVKEHFDPSLLILIDNEGVKDKPQPFHMNTAARITALL